MLSRTLSLPTRALIALAFCLATSLQAQEPTIVQPFEGSAPVGQYVAEFDQVTVLVDDGDGFERVSVEGTVRATLLTAPEEIGALQVARSFEQALEAAGFEILFSRRTQRGNDADPGFAAQRWIRDLQDINAPRDYVRAEGAASTRTALDRTYTFAEYYLSARKATETEETYFAMTFEGSRRHYLMEEVTRALMAEDNVTISALEVTSGIDAEGKAILYGVQFDVGSAVLRPSSTPSIEVIAEVLRERDGNFYVVGHTSDTGSFDLNMQLSRDRAASIVEALGRDYGIDISRLQPVGVGPVAPLATNTSEIGRELNRRVELVERLDP
ncbi:MAG: OmpA family protein [Pseudomonadota bacterium]